MYMVQGPTAFQVIFIPNSDIVHLLKMPIKIKRPALGMREFKKVGSVPVPGNKSGSVIS